MKNAERTDWSLHKKKNNNCHSLINHADSFHCIAKEIKVQNWIEKKNLKIKEPEGVIQLF